MTAAGGHAASTLSVPAARVVKVALNMRRESGFGEPWKRAWSREIDGFSEGHLNCTSTVGDASLAELSVKVQCEWAVVAGRVNPGAASESHTVGEPSTVRHIIDESVGAVEVTSAETVPGPSLVNENVRIALAGSARESRVRSPNVTVAVGNRRDGTAVLEGSGVGLALGLEEPGLRDGVASPTEEVDVAVTWVRTAAAVCC